MGGVERASVSSILFHMNLIHVNVRAILGRKCGAIRDTLVSLKLAAF